MFRKVLRFLSDFFCLEFAQTHIRFYYYHTLNLTKRLSTLFTLIYSVKTEYQSLYRNVLTIGPNTRIEHSYPVLVK